MTESEELIRAAEDSGWEWQLDGSLMHPDDQELKIQRQPKTGDALLSPKLVKLLAIENWHDQ